MLQKKISITLLYSFFSLYVVFGQYNINHFTTGNGLPSNGIKGMQWDASTGFLWLATDAGAVRYNGISFKVFDISTNPDLGSNRLIFIKKNTAGKILLADEFSNLLAVNGNTIHTLLRNKNSGGYNSNSNAAIDTDSLCSTCYKSPWPENEFSRNTNNSVLLNDTACLSAEAGKVYYYSVTVRNPSLVYATVNDVKNLFKTGTGLYYLTNSNKIYSYSINTNQSVQQELFTETDAPFIIHNNHRLLWQEGMEVPVLLQQGKAWVIESKSNNKLYVKQVANSIPTDVSIHYAYYEQQSKYLFLGTLSKGLYIINPQTLKIKKPVDAEKFEINSFYSQVELPDGNVITDQGKIIGDKTIKNNYNLGNGFANRIFQLNKDELILSRNDSFFVYNRKRYSKRILFVSPSAGNDFAFAWSSGNLYFVSKEGINIVKGGSLQNVKKFESPSSAPYNMIEIRPGKLLLATCYGLLSFDTETKKLDTIFKLTLACIRTLYKEGDYLLFGTYGGGYYVMKDGVVKAVPLDAKKYLKYAHCFMKDDNGFVWISTNNGLFKARMKDITDAFDKLTRKNQETPQIYYHFFGKEDGMKNTEMNGGCTPCAIRLENNYFSFPTIDGLLWFNPVSILPVLPLGNVFIDKIVVNATELPLPDDSVIPLPVDVKQLDIVLALSVWCKKENLYLQFKLDESGWLPVEFSTGEPVLSFYGLGYGKHVLTIRKLNGFGSDNYSYTTIILDVAVPFYHQWWFRVCAVLFTGCCIYFIFRWRLKQYQIREQKTVALVKEKTKDLLEKNEQLEKNDEVKTRLISVINHDIITPLKFMNYAGLALIGNKKTVLPEEQMKTIADITQTAKEMEILSSQILNWIIYQNPSKQMQMEEFDIHRLVNTIFRALDFPAKQKNLQLVNEVTVHFIIYQYMEPLRVLIYNLVMNSLNFTKHGTVKVNTWADDNHIIIKVTDTGLGMTDQQITNIQSDDRIIASANVDNRKGTGLGYMIIKDLLKILGGTLRVTSVKNKGTTVFITLSKANDTDKLKNW